MQLRQFPRYVISDVVVGLVQCIADEIFYAHNKTHGYPPYF
jgi:hypothetical protein